MEAEQADPQEARIGRIINEYIDRKKRGEPVSEEDVLQANPDLAHELREHLEVVRQVISVTSGVGGGLDSSPVLPKDALPGYEILSEIHRGAQGVVYLALQKATRRNVAVKVTREGPFAGWRDRARFDREIHVLGALRHPCIVTIHDSGTAAGCQFFVMDYIAGSPLDQWMTAAPRDIRQILTPFVDICDAINAAHIKGIIHRDLKPGNIRMDEEGRPHILDFGLAKLATDREADRVGMTVVGQFVGSLPWTGPEQAQGLLDQIDTRTDVYALGVILFQMLTGKFPYEVVGPVRDVLNRIVTSESVAPSTMRKGIDKDLDAIVLKCLRKEPQRRYQTAGELGRDISSYLNGQAIAARSDSGLYVLGKLLRRHQTAVGVATAFAILIGASLLASVSLWRRAARQRDRAITAEHRADAKAVEAQQARGTAELERAIAQEQAQRARRFDYVHTIALAQNACEQNNMAQVHHLLEGCSPDLREWEWYYLARLSRSPALLDIATGSGSVTSLAISPDGQRIATGGWGGALQIWNTQTGRLVTQLKGPSLQVNALSWSADGFWIASGGVDMTLRLWDVRTGTPKIIQEGKEYVNGVAFSPDSTRLASGGMSKVLSFWEVPGGRALGRTAEHEGEVSCVAYQPPDGKFVASGEYLNALRYKTSKVMLWDVSTMQGRPIVEHLTSVLAIGFNPSGSRIASGSGISASGESRGSLKVSNSTTGEEVLSLRGHEGSVEALAFSPTDGKLLASTGTPRTVAVGAESDHTLKIWDATTGAQICDYSAHKGGGKAVAWSPDGKRVYSGGADGRLKAWPSTPPAGARIMNANSGPVLRVAFSPDGRRIASSNGPIGAEHLAAGEPSVRVWDSRTGAQLLQLAGHKAGVPGLAWTFDGKSIVSADTEGTLLLSNAVTGQPRWSVGGANQDLQDAATSPDPEGSELIATLSGTTTTLWKVSDGTIYRQLQSSDALVAVDFSLDGRWVVAAASNGEVKLWSRATGDEDYTLSTGAGLSSMALSHDSKIIVIGRTDGSIALWNIATRQPLATMNGPQVPVLCIAISPDSERIASCAADNQLRIWDVQSAGEVYSLPAHDARITSVAFSPDGGQIATSGQDGLIKIWDAEIESATQPAGTVAGK